MSDLRVCVVSGRRMDGFGGGPEAEAVVYAPHGQVVARFIVGTGMRTTEAELRDRARRRGEAYIAADETERAQMMHLHTLRPDTRNAFWRARGL